MTPSSVTSADLRAAIEATLGEVPCPAVDVAYTVAVRDALRARLSAAPSAPILDVYYTTSAFTVSASVGAASARIDIPLT